MKMMPKKNRGFSLIEVMIALAILSTLALTLVGVLPMAFKNIQEATDLSVVARIVQTISSDAQSSDWDEFLASYSNLCESARAS